jgi:hypothetical protein
LTDDVVALRAEINAALDVVVPQVRGLSDLLRTSLIAASQYEVERVLGLRRRREHLLNDVIGALDALDRAMESLIADDYPNLPNVDVTGEAISDLAEERADLTSALSVFHLDRAARLVIHLGDPEPKPNP